MFLQRRWTSPLNVPLWPILFLFCTGCFFSSQITDGSGTQVSESISGDPVRAERDGESLEVSFSVTRKKWWRTDAMLTHDGWGRSQSEKRRTLKFDESGFESYPFASLVQLTGNDWLEGRQPVQVSVLRETGELPVYYFSSNALGFRPDEESVMVMTSRIYWFKPDWRGRGPSMKTLFETTSVREPNSDLRSLIIPAWFGDALLFVPAAALAMPYTMIRSATFTPSHQSIVDGIRCDRGFLEKSPITQTELFNLASWKSGGPSERAPMFYDLGRRLNRGRPNRAQLLSILGPADIEKSTRSEGRNYLTRMYYVLKKGRTTIDFSPQRNKLEEAFCLMINFQPSGLYSDAEVNGWSITGLESDRELSEKRGEKLFVGPTRDVFYGTASAAPKP